MFDNFRKLMPILALTLAVLNLLDYLTTVYALTNVPNAYETNFALADLDLMFRVKMINANLLLIFFVGIAVAFEKMKNQDRTIKLIYYVQLIPLLLVVGSYTLTVINNAYICLTHTNLEPLNSLNILNLQYDPNLDYVSKVIDWILKLPNLPE